LQFRELGLAVRDQLASSRRQGIPSGGIANDEPFVHQAIEFPPDLGKLAEEMFRQTGDFFKFAPGQFLQNGGVGDSLCPTIQPLEAFIQSIEDVGRKGMRGGIPPKPSILAARRLFDRRAVPEECEFDSETGIVLGIEIRLLRLQLRDQGFGVCKTSLSGLILGDGRKGDFVRRFDKNCAESSQVVGVAFDEGTRFPKAEGKCDMTRFDGLMSLRGK